MSEIDDLEETLYPRGYLPLDPIKLSAREKSRRGLFHSPSKENIRELRAKAAERHGRPEPSLPQFKCLQD